MAEENEDALKTLLEAGWSVAGYSTVIMAAGAMVHSILLQSGNDLTTVNIVKNGGKELGRTVDQFAPMPAQKKGWF